MPLLHERKNPNFSSTLNGHKLSNKAQLLVVRSSLSMPAKRQTEMCVINNHQRAHQQRTLRQSRAEPTNYVVTCKRGKRSPSFWQSHSRVSNRIMWHATLAFSGCRPSYVYGIIWYGMVYIPVPTHPVLPSRLPAQTLPNLLSSPTDFDLFSALLPFTA